MTFWKDLLSSAINKYINRKLEIWVQRPFIFVKLSPIIICIDRDKLSVEKEKRNKCLIQFRKQSRKLSTFSYSSINSIQSTTDIYKTSSILLRFNFLLEWIIQHIKYLWLRVCEAPLWRKINYAEELILGDRGTQWRIINHIFNSAPWDTRWGLHL